MNPGNISSWLSRWRQYGIIGILGSLLMVNVATVALFWYDKHQAKTGGWRVPERTLQGTAALGGWPAGYVAMEMFHHKTKKQSFRVGYHAATAANVGLASYGLNRLEDYMERLQPIRVGHIAMLKEDVLGKDKKQKSLLKQYRDTRTALDQVYSIGPERVEGLLEKASRIRHPRRLWQRRKSRRKLHLVEIWAAASSLSRAATLAADRMAAEAGTSTFHLTLCWRRCQ
eukprot:g1117.t1